jgi:hypothetical protein
MEKLEAILLDLRGTLDSAWATIEDNDKRFSPIRDDVADALDQTEDALDFCRKYVCIPSKEAA